jgi:hypothetical protein
LFKRRQAGDSRIKAPTDKQNDIIQILVTRACDLFHCSNCTQLLPFRSDPVHMSVDVFRRACESVRDWPGIVAMFGGNPCVHPKFPELCEVMSAIIPPEHRGLWTNNLRGHGKIAAKTFGKGRLNLNAHADVHAADEMERWFPGRVKTNSRDTPSWHSPILMDYRDLDVSDEQWVVLREDCDINKYWSAAIMQRGSDPYAYFCEVAGAIDGVRGKNHGIPAVPGWWHYKMDRFNHQVRNCCNTGCGVPLRRRGHLDRDNTYDATERWVPLTVTKRHCVRTVKYKAMPDGTSLATDYLPNTTCMK